MHFYGLQGKKIELSSAGEESLRGSLSDVVGAPEVSSPITDLAYDATRLGRATRRFFGMAAEPGSLRMIGPRRSPSIYRDALTNLLRCFYREIIIHFRADVSDRKRRANLKEFNLEIVRLNQFEPNQVIVRDPDDKRHGDDLIEVANLLAERDGDIVFAVPNFVSEFERSAFPIPPAQWHLDNTGHFPGQTAGEDVHARLAWQVTTGDSAIIVAVLDDGVDIDHPALRNQIWRNSDVASPDRYGRDFFVSETDPGHYDPRPKSFRNPFDDPTGNDIHGTCCAGLIAAKAPDARAFGVAPDCRILAVKMLHAGELASDERVANAINYAATIADVISCSWSGPETPQIEHAIQKAASSGRNGRGCAVFCSTGNDGNPFVKFPASVDAAVAVGASTDKGTLAPYSNFGDKVSLVAPSSGGARNIFTCDVSLPNRGFNLGADSDGGVDGLYTNAFGGTSAAAPMVAGAAAVILSKASNLTAAELKSLLEQTADKIGGGFDEAGRSPLVGFGRVNTRAALNSVP